MYVIKQYKYIYKAMCEEYSASYFINDVGGFNI